MSSSTCYWPDGSVAEGNVPCKNVASGGYSYCCDQSHYCFTNGLCMDPKGMTTYRGGCTDSTFNSNSCSKYCLVYSTVSGVWACDSNNQFACLVSDCGNSTQMFTVPSGSVMAGAAVNSALGISATSTTSSQSSTAAASTMTVVCNPDQTSTAGDSSKSYSGGDMAAVGAGVGVPLLLALLAALFFLFKFRRNHANSNNMVNGNDLNGQSSIGYAQNATPMYVGGPYKPSQVQPVQLESPSPRPIQELDTRN